MKLFRALQYTLLCWIAVSMLMYLKLGDNWTGLSNIMTGMASINSTLIVAFLNASIEASSRPLTASQSSHDINKNSALLLGESSPEDVENNHGVRMDSTPTQGVSKEDSRKSILHQRSSHPPRLMASSSSPRSKIPKQNDTFRYQDMPWMEFVKLPSTVLPPSAKKSLRLDAAAMSHLTFCSADVEAALTAPLLDAEAVKWCRWALSSAGGNVKVGKSYGSLSAEERGKYEKLQCNTVAQDTNPSCDDIWGEKLVSFWKANVMPELCSSPSSSSPGQYTSRVRCIESVVRHRMCTFEHVMFDFRHMRSSYRKSKQGARAQRNEETRTREFDPGFMGTHCEARFVDIDYFPFYRPSVTPNSTVCNVVIDEPVLAFSHDDLRNLGHALSDIMNVWLMLWLTGLTAHSHEVTFLNIDSFRGGHNFDDDLFDFGLHYERNFARVLKATDLAEQSGTVCFKKLVVQPKPLILFTWDGWWQDMPCSFVGPSSLYKRWNLQVRDNYGLLGEEHMITNKKMRVLLITRRLGSISSLKYSSRVIRNEDAVMGMLGNISSVEFLAQDLAAMSFEEQLRLIGSVGIVIGMHGAGIPNSMHMSVGSRYCCGVIEIFPDGEFKAIRGYGNMARKMGHLYSSIMLDRTLTSATGTAVDVNKLHDTVVDMIKNIVDKPTQSCILPKVVSDPYFDSYPAKIWD